MEDSAGRNYHDCTVLAPASPHLKSDRTEKRNQIAALSHFMDSIHYNVLITNEMHNSYIQFFYSTVFHLLYMFPTNLVVHHQEHGTIYCITQLWYNRTGESSCYEVVGKTYLQLHSS